MVMLCPVCTGTNLLMTDRQGVEIDYCPSCRGVWLDRGELDKIIERSTGSGVTPPSPTRNPGTQQVSPTYDRGHRPDDSSDDGLFGRGQRRKKKSLLGELFDF
jgi:Zn-finger nucleic acid-binding protein